MKPTISITPNNCLADDEVKIHVQGLQSNQKVTLYAVLERSDVGNFDSYAHYTASQDGTIDLGKDISTGGTYTGIEPMGLFWSMKPSKNMRPTDRFLVNDIENPIVTSFRVFDSHLKYEYFLSSEYWSTGEALAKAFVRRWYKRPEVRRVPVRWKKVRGILFIPKGKGPFPALIDIFGLAGRYGRLIEYRASLFASRGYLCLALAYFDYDDLPTYWNGDGVDLEYFEEAKDFLQSRPETNQNEIGIVGTSFGGMLALACASYIPGFKCAVSINGPVFVYRTNMRYKGRTWEPKFGNLDNTFEENGAVAEKYCFDDDYDFERNGNSLIDFCGSNKSFLFIFGKDDNAFNNVKAAAVTEKLIQKGNGDYKIVSYPGAGHFLEPPHFPLTSKTYFKFLTTYRSWGGQPKEHARAQELAWTEILSFLDKHLAVKTSQL